MLVILCTLFLIGCHSNRETEQKGPLSKIKAFEVFAFFSPYETFDQDFLFRTLVDSLRMIGKVEIIPTSCASTSCETRHLLFLSLGGYEQENQGSIQIISSVSIDVNQVKINCPIWKMSYDSNQKNWPYPEMEDGKIVFKRPSQETVKLSPDAALKEMVANFVDEYYRFNSKGEKPIFYIYQSLSKAQEDSILNENPLENESNTTPMQK